jgi:hypothetical protein
MTDNNQFQNQNDNINNLNPNTNSNLLINLPPNFGNNNNYIKNTIKKKEDLPISSIIENKKQLEREPLLAGYRNMNLPPNNFNYQEEKNESVTFSLINSPLFIIMTVICVLIYGLIFYMISAKR